MTRVFLVDDHEIVRRGVAELINAENDLEVVGEAANGRDAMARIAATTPEVAVLDVRLPDINGVDLCRDIRSEFPEVKCIMLTAYDDDAASVMAVLAGAAAYVLKDIRGARLVESIRRVAKGEVLVNRGASRQYVERTADLRDPVTALTLRERQVLQLITDGLTNRQIGERLQLAEKTVKNYVSGLFAKLGVERRTQAAVFGAELKRR